MSSGKKQQTIGYKYYLGQHLVLCHGPIDKITSIKFDEKTAWSGDASGGSISLNAPDLFGGERNQGGVSGTVDVLQGLPTQTTNDYLVSKLGSLVPAFRGVFSLVFRQLYMGMNPYLKTPSFRCQRVMVRYDGLAQWYSSKALIGQDMNPAHIIRECLTDPYWGMGYPETDMDDTTFISAADTLYSESMGMSLLWDKTKTMDDFITEVLRHIDGSLYVDRKTGKFCLKLVRGGYSIGSLTTLNEDCIDKVTDFKRNTLDELVNSVTVVYWDQATGKDGSVTVQDVALAAQQQGCIATTKHFPGFTNGTNATRAASRTLRQLSTPLATCVIYANRVAASLNIGDPFILSWEPNGITHLVMRVANIEFGDLGNNVVKVTAIEDAFATSPAIYAPPPVSGWTEPNSVPTASQYHCVMEATYWELAQLVGDANAKAIPITSGYTVATCVRPSSDAINATLYSDPTDNNYTSYGTVDFCPTAQLNADITINQTIVPIWNTVDIDSVLTGTYAVLGTEIVSIVAVSNTSLTIGRGVLDTVPVAHVQNERIFFADVYFGSNQVEMARGETERIKLCPSTAKGILAVADAPTQTVTIQSRSSRPYPPQRLRINGLEYPDSVPGNADIVISWAHRDRLQQTVNLVDTTVASIGPEAGTTYNCHITYMGVRILSHIGITGATTTFTLAELGNYYGRIGVELLSVRDGLESTQRHNFQFTRAGYGAGYGYSYGGA